MNINIPETDKKRVVIVGGGFGGLALANKLKKSNYQVVLIDKNNYHQFLPLIYQVASAGLEPASISFPFRKIFQKRKDFYFRLGKAISVLPDKKILQTTIGDVSYDYLVFAMGTTSNFFGNKNFEQESIPMKNVSEAMGLRNALLANYECSMVSSTEEEKQEFLNIVIVGGGATGVEIAGALSEMKRFILPKDYPEMDTSKLNIHLIEAGDRLLAGMSPTSSAEAKKSLLSKGVNIHMNSKVVDYHDRKVVLETGEEIPTRSFIWVSGVSAELVDNVDPSLIGRGRRMKVDAFNRLEGYEDIFCIGDQSLQTTDKAYQGGHPQLAQVAIQQGNLLATNLINLSKQAEMKPFAYKDLGSMATIGRNSAVAEFAGMKLHGFIAWAVWLTVHLRSILGIRNRILVLFNWIWNYFTYDQSFRLIVYARKAKVVREQEEREANREARSDV